MGYFTMRIAQKKTTSEEPFYSLSRYGATVDVVEDWLQVLDDQNKVRVNTNQKLLSMSTGCFKVEKIVQLVFFCCEMLKLNEEAKYLAIELYDRFMTQHIWDLHNHVKCENSSNESKEDKWMDIERRVKAQMKLRIVSCCQLASKLISHYRVVTVRKAKTFLAQIDENYTSESILQSELRILKTLTFDLRTPSPLVYVEALLKAVAYQQPGINVKVYSLVALKLMDLFYMRRTMVYDKLYMLATGKSDMNTADRKTFIAVESDLMLFGCAVTTASSYLVDHPNSDKVMRSLSKITRIPWDDILDLAIILIQLATATDTKELPLRLKPEATESV